MAGIQLFANAMHQLGSVHLLINGCACIHQLAWCLRLLTPGKAQNHKAACLVHFAGLFMTVLVMTLLELL